MSGGSEFHAAGPARDKAHSPNLVRSRGITYLLLEADRKPCVAYQIHRSACTCVCVFYSPALLHIQLINLAQLLHFTRLNGSHLYFTNAA